MNLSDKMDKSTVEDAIPPSQGPPDEIKPIGRDTVHRICSGQVVLSLGIAVKELIENSIDAGATRIDILLKEYGSEIIQVSDNGSGVKKANLQALTLKHHTSKIRQFEDLESVTTLGFRGEALSSLCALSDLAVITRHQSSDLGSKVTYDHNGIICDETIEAREIGTTVTLKELFASLPVRRREFLKNLKREFTKMCNLLHSYCLVSKGIKFSCSNVVNGKRTSVISTEGQLTIKENIISLFGTKTLASLVEVDLNLPGDDIKTEYAMTQSVDDSRVPFSFVFLVSSVMAGSGRSSADRQFFYINDRPCEPTKISKLVNQIYRQYNSSQYPFVFLNVCTRDCTLVDVNVTPDKRQIFIEQEKVLLAIIKASLIECFKAFPSTYKVQNVDAGNRSIVDFYESDVGEKRGGKKGGSCKRSFSENCTSRKSGNSGGSILQRFGVNSKRSKTEDFTGTRTRSRRKSSSDSDSEEDLSMLHKSVDEDLKKFSRVASDLLQERQSEKTVCRLSTVIKDKIVTRPTSDAKLEALLEASADAGKTIDYDPSDATSDPSDVNNVTEVEIVIDSPSTATKVTNRNDVTVTVSLDDIRLLNSDSVGKSSTANSDDNEVRVRFRSEISPDANQSAEEELRKHIAKEDFKDMEVLGQFNLGFLITRLGDDLFIIDQHATDEIYNFEQLQLNTVLEKQILVNPKPLELTAGNETLLIENEDIFNKNGFTFNIDHSAPCTKKIQLTSIPISKNFICGKDDIDEMLFMMQDSSHQMCRPSRVRAMFASRACRKSVMIGTSLARNEMEKLVRHMSEIERPWNCPHGRPTMRHLINLALIQH